MSRPLTEAELIDYLAHGHVIHEPRVVEEEKSHDIHDA